MFKDLRITSALRCHMHMKFTHCLRFLMKRTASLLTAHSVPVSTGEEVRWDDVDDDDDDDDDNDEVDDTQSD